MPNGFYNEIDAEQELRRLEEILNKDDPKETFRFFGRRLIHMEQAIDNRIKPIEENQSYLLDRIWKQLPSRVKYTIISSAFIWLVMTIVVMCAGFSIIK